MIEREIVNQKAIVSFNTEFTIQEVKEMKNILKEFEEKEIYKLVFDISKVRYIDSSAIGMLVQTLKFTKNNSGYLKLYSPTEEVKRILKLVNLFPFFEVIDNLE